MMPVMVNPVSITFGKIRTGSLVSSAMFTESSKPTIAKNASDVAVVTARNRLLSSGVSKAITREKSALPPKIANSPTMITSSSPDSSTRVSTTLALTLSPTPRKLTIATSVMNPSAISTMPQLPSSRSNPSARFDAKARDAVDAEVMPEHITTNATRNVKKWMPNALWVYSAAPAACGYLVTSSR